MATIPGYQLVELLDESPQSLIYRGWRDSDKTPVILKILNQEYPSLEKISRFRLEYDINHRLNLDGVVKVYGLEIYQYSLVMILEDFGGESLNKLMQMKSFTLEEFLCLAIQITEILGEIHRLNIIHKDINPSNIIFNATTGKVKIIDFGIAIVLSRETLNISNPNVLEGTLAYMSPEQTGRMNRIIDYRSDFYSLGITFYQLLCHRLPFETDDAIELVHCHIAKQPISPHEINPEVPTAVSNLVMKLLAKNAGERYQSSYGIQSDLQKCWHQLQTNGKIKDFPLGCQDGSNKLQISQKIYGREREFEILLSAFERVTGNLGKEDENQQEFSRDSLLKPKIEMMLVSGYPGIGKSALVQEIYKPITQKNGYFICGKFDPLGQNTPYNAFIQAFRELIRQLLTESEDKITIWKNKLRDALGINGQVIIDVIPQIELIIGKQADVLELPTLESQNRFNLVFQNFVNVFAQPEHPLIIFLDDLQWADQASLQLIKLLMTASNSHYVLLIGAYRDNEVSAIHTLMLILDEIKMSGAIINCISLLPLELTAINQLINDTLNCESEKSKLLAELVKNKTDGNPFFITEFLKSLYQHKLLLFDSSILADNGKNRSGWQWNLEEIKAAPFTDNVVDLMITKIKSLSPLVQEILKLAACIGNQFDSQTVSIIDKNSQTETVSQLWNAVEQGLILPIGNYTQHFLDKSKINNQNLFGNRVFYKFIHDRVQQAVYSLISEIDKKQIHLKIGQMILKSTPLESLSEQIFEIVNQLNLGSELITEQEEKDELAKLNLVAGKKAKASVAYEAAFKYFNIGKNLLGEKSWSQAYELTLEIYSLAAEAAYLCGDFAQMEELAEGVLKQSQTLLDKLKGYEVKIQAYVVQNKFSEAIQMAVQALKLLGVSIPTNPSKLDILSGRIRTKFALAGKRIEDLIKLPKMTNINKLAAMRIIASVCTPTYFIAPELWQMMVFQKIQLSLQYGNAPGSPFGYADYGMVLCAVEKNIDSSYQFAQLALNLLSRLNAQKFKPKTFLLVNIYIRHWKEHLKETLNPLREAYQHGLETGDLEYAIFSIVFYCYHCYLVGKELVQLEQEMISYHNQIARFKQETPLYVHKIYHQSVLNLINSSENPGYLRGESYQEDKYLPLHLAINDQYTIFHLYLNKLILCYLFEQYLEAVKNAAKAEHLLLDGAMGLLVVPIFYFYDSLASLAQFYHVSKSRQQQILKKVAVNQKKMKQWAHHAPMNYLHKFYLVEAEIYRVIGKDIQAMEAYDRAISLANEHGYINELALANELAAKFYLAKDKPKIAQVYLLDSRSAYLQWGATAKVKDLEIRYPQLLERISTKSRKGTNSFTTTESTVSEVLELATVMKASQALSGEIVLDKLLAKLMTILMENAGAEKGFLILETQEKLLIEAAVNINQESVILQSIPLENRDDKLPLSTALINYVARTQENIVLNNATVENKFSQDPYIIQYRPKSILCTPLINQGKLSGILYLENNLTTDAFTAERIEVLQLLSAQAAIAIDHARLYNQLEIRVQERTLELTQANEQLEQLTIELQRSNQELEQFAYIASHDLQEPLRAVASYTQLLAKRYQGKLDEKADIYIGFAVDGATRMQQLIQDLLAYSRVGRYQLKRQLTDCNLVVKKVLKDLQITIRENQAIITVDPLPIIFADTVQITLLFQNLISNAIKYHGEKQPQIHISAVRIKEEKKKSEFIFKVCDNGIGIEPQYTEQIFGIFQRLHTSDEYSGTGLGLAICQKIIERHGGKIWVESQLGEGSLFCFEIAFEV